MPDEILSADPTLDIEETHEDPQEAMRAALEREGLLTGSELNLNDVDDILGDAAPANPADQHGEPSALTTPPVEQPTSEQTAQGLQDAADDAGQTVADYLVAQYGEQGRKIAEKYGNNDEQILHGLANAHSALSTRDEDAQVGRMFRSQWPAFQQYLAQQHGGQVPSAPQTGYYPPLNPQQQGQQETPKVENHLKFNKMWDEWNTEEGWKGPAAEEVNYRVWMERAKQRQIELIDQEPTDINEQIRTAVQESLSNYQKTEQARIADYEFAKSFMSENAQWLFEGGKAPQFHGMQMAPGQQSRLTEAGQRFFQHYAGIMQQGGGNIAPSVAADYAARAVTADLLPQFTQRMQQQANQQRQTQTPTPNVPAQGGQQQYNQLAPATNQPSLTTRPPGEAVEFSGDIVKDGLRLMEEYGIRPDMTIDELRELEYNRR